MKMKTNCKTSVSVDSWPPLEEGPGLYLALYFLGPSPKNNSNFFQIFSNFFFTDSSHFFSFFSFVFNIFPFFSRFFMSLQHVDKIWIPLQAPQTSQVEPWEGHTTLRGGGVVCPSSLEVSYQLTNLFYNLRIFPQFHFLFGLGLRLIPAQTRNGIKINSSPNRK